MYSTFTVLSKLTNIVLFLATSFKTGKRNLPSSSVHLSHSCAEINNTIKESAVTDIIDSPSTTPLTSHNGTLTTKWASGSIVTRLTDPRYTFVRDQIGHKG